MKETPQAFARRTGRAYAPPPALLAALPAGGRALRPRESCPTLFRYPGPLGLARLLQGLAGPLAPGDRFVWLAAAADGCGPAAHLFGSLGLLEPLRLSPCLAPDEGERRFLARNAEVREGEALVWVPPLAAAQAVDWDRVRDPDDARRRLGPDYDGQRRAALDTLSGYVEELSALQTAGAPDPGRPWHEVPVEERRRLLEHYGVDGRWSGR